MVSAFLLSVGRIAFHAKVDTSTNSTLDRAVADKHVAAA